MMVEAIEITDTAEAPPVLGGMQLFTELVNVLGTSTKTNDKLDALSHYFSIAGD